MSTAVSTSHDIAPTTGVRPTHCRPETRGSTRIRSSKTTCRAPSKSSWPREDFEMATSGTPDLLIHYHASINQRIDVNRVDQAIRLLLRRRLSRRRHRVRGRHTRARHRRQPHEPGGLAWLGPGHALRACSTTGTRWRGRSTRPSHACSPGFRRVFRATVTHSDPAIEALLEGA